MKTKQSIFKKVFIYLFFVVFISISFSPLLTAQVNINSSQGTKSKFYELTDTIIEYKNAQTDTTQLKQNDFLGLFTTTTRDSAGNLVYSSVFSGIEQMLNNSSFIPDPIKRFIVNNSLPTSLSFGVFLLLLPLILSFLPLLLAPQLLFVLLGSLFGERKNVLGIVYDESNRKPLPFVVVRLYKAESTQLIAQKVSDLQGRYGFILSEGKYRISVNQSGYQTFQKEVEVSQQVELFAEDIALSQEPKSSFVQFFTKIYQRIRAWIFKYSIVLSIVGFIFSLIGFYLKRGLLDFILLAIYTLVLGIYVLLKIKDRKRNYGVVKDSKSGLLISGAFVRIFDNKKSLSDTQITDENGRYSFFVEAGEYTLFAQAYGYKFPSTMQQNEVKSTSNSSLLSFKADKAEWVNKTIYVDPDLSNSQPRPNFNLANGKLLPYKVENLTNPF